jgi:hypothetical protein
MPNYCENELFVRGDNVLSFYEENQDKTESIDLSFMKAVPVPSRNCDECVRLWGTKWDACDSNASISESEIYYFFQSAWTPPIAWLRAVAAKYPTLDFELEAREPGVDFYIHIVFEKGVEVSSEESTYTDYLRKKHDLDALIEKIFQKKKVARKCRTIVKNEDSLEEYFEDDACDEEIRTLVEELESSDIKDALFHLIETKVHEEVKKTE